MNISLTDMNLIQMSFSAAVMILAIIVVRAMAINKLPKKVFVLLWEVVLLRLLVPFSIPSTFSAYTFMRRNESPQGAMTEVPPAVEVITQVTEIQTNKGVKLDTTLPPQSNVQDIPLLEIVWVVGLLLCAAYFTVSYLRCYFEFQTSLPVRNEFTVKWLREHRLKRTIQIRQSDRISAPLTYGIVRPVILMSKKTDWENRQQLDYVLLHEYTHICRFDMVVKLIAAFALCIHWFNPFVWAMYILINRDIELSCDESVVRQFGETSKSVYARTLITMEEKKSGLTPLYNSFSRNAIEERITAIMKTRKITIGILVASVLVITAIVVPFATSAKKQETENQITNKNVVEEEKQITNENVVEEEKQRETNENTEEGIVAEGVEETGTALEMAQIVVRQQYADMKGAGYVNWKIDSLTEEYVYDFGGDRESGGLRVTVYQLDYSFLAKNPENVVLVGGMTMDEEGWVIPEYPNSTYLCLVSDGGALSYVVLTENDCYPGDEIFTEDLKQRLGIDSATEEDYYSVATSLSASEVEQFALDIKNDILASDWKSLSEKISYPITISGINVTDSAAFQKLDLDGMINPEFVNAVAAENCREMFCNWQGIMMGATGQVWIGSVDSRTGQWELKIIGINGMLESTVNTGEGSLEETTGEVPQEVKDIMAAFYTEFFDAEGTAEKLQPYLSET